MKSGKQFPCPGLLAALTVLSLVLLPLRVGANSPTDSPAISAPSESSGTIETVGVMVGPYFAGFGLLRLLYRSALYWEKYIKPAKLISEMGNHVAIAFHAFLQQMPFQKAARWIKREGDTPRRNMKRPKKMFSKVPKPSRRMARSARKSHRCAKA